MTMQFIIIIYVKKNLQKCCIYVDRWRDGLMRGQSIIEGVLYRHDTHSCISLFVCLFVIDLYDCPIQIWHGLERLMCESENSCWTFFLLPFFVMTRHSIIRLNWSNTKEFTWSKDFELRSKTQFSNQLTFKQTTTHFNSIITIIMTVTSNGEVTTKAETINKSSLILFYNVSLIKSHCIEI